jgi:hypothetical protein
MTSHAYTGLLTEQAAAEDALAEVSGYVYNKQNPQPQLVIPFMRVDREHSEEQRRDFTEQILTPNIFPLKVVLGHVDLATRN